MLRERLVGDLIAGGRIRRAAVADAFRAVPRHAFLPGVPVEQAYGDAAIPTKWADGRPVSSSSQPSIMAVMLEQLDVRPGDRVLEVGAGTGYNAALLAQLAGEGGVVVTVDVDGEVAAEARERLDGAARVVHADGALGHAELAPYDRIVVTAGAWDVAPAWLDQLAPAGRIVLPLSLRGVQRSVALQRRDDHLASNSVAVCGFMRMRGAAAGPERSMSLGDDVLLDLPDDRPVDAEAVAAALAAPGAELPTGLAVTRAECFDGLALWLALSEAPTCIVSALGEAIERGAIPALIAFPGVAVTCGLLDGGELALLAPGAGDGAFELSVRCYGAAGELGARLVERVRAWDAAGRRATDGLRVRAYPRGAALPDGAAIIAKAATTLVLDWLSA